MTDYEAEHNLTVGTTTSVPSTRPRRRPSLTTFYSSLRNIETEDDNVGTDGPDVGAGGRQRHNAPLPVNVEAAFVLLAEALTDMRSPSSHDRPEEGDFDPSSGHANDELLDSMLSFLRNSAADPPERVEGVSEEFLAELDRVDKKKLGKGECPICGEKFIDDPYPLVVRLPCHPDHKFDYECIRPWLKLNPTCPLDRKDLVKKPKPTVVPKPVDDEEEDYDDYFA